MLVEMTPEERKITQEWILQAQKFSDYWDKQLLNGLNNSDSKTPEEERKRRQDLWEELRNEYLFIQSVSGNKFELTDTGKAFESWEKYDEEQSKIEYAKWAKISILIVVLMLMWERFGEVIKEIFSK